MMTYHDGTFGHLQNNLLPVPARSCYDRNVEPQHLYQIRGEQNPKFTQSLKTFVDW